MKIYNDLPEEYQQYIDISTGGPRLNWMKTKNKLQCLMAQHKKQLHQSLQLSFANEADFTGSTVDKIKVKKERIKADKKLYATLRHHFHPTTRSCISHLLLPDKDAEGNPTDDPDVATTWKSETCPQDTLDKLLDRNIKHFGQAQGSPFTTSPLLDKFGYDGMTTQGIKLSQDSIPPSGIDNISSVTKDILHRLSNKDMKHPIQHDLISFASFTSAIKKWRESTSTSPSGRHLGHYKSLVAIDSNSSKYDEANPDPGLDILQVIYHISAAAFQTGCTLNRWTDITTCMIEKTPGTPRINKLRIIHLYEADYNVMNKLIWQRAVVWTAHNRGTLNSAQSGSRPYHTCIEVVISKEMKYLYSLLTRTAMATMDNDAKSCYDRIVAALALMISHHFGVPEEICRTVGETLRTMKFRLRTAMVDSKYFYSHSPTTPIHGVGQGGTASPAFWLLVSSTLFDCHREHATGMTLTDPTCRITLRQWLEALVDDSSIFTNVESTDSVATLISTLQQDAQYWENLLSISGGCLELSKCFYYVLAWKFTTKGAPVPMTMDNIALQAPAIQIQEFNKEEFTSIASKAPEMAHKTLGVWKAMIANDTVHVNHLKTSSFNMASIVATSGLRPHQADVALRMIYTPAMTYSLPSVNISEKVLNKIQNKSLESFKPALGFNGHFPNAVMLGPKEFGGEGVPHLHTESHIQKIEIIMAHLRGNTELGTLFRINLGWIHMLVGRGEEFLNSHYDIPYVQSWFTGIRNFLIQINGRLQIPDLFLPKLERVGDAFIMAEMANITPKISANQLNYINNWRVYYQVITLSDLCNAKGESILDLYLKNPKASNIKDLRIDRISTLRWPIQPPPQAPSTFKIWLRYIKLCFLRGSTHKLREALGPWTTSPADSFSKWHGYMSADHKSFIRRDGDTFHQYSTLLHSTPGTKIFEQDNIPTILTVLPSTCVPIDFEITSSNQIKVYCSNRISSIPKCEVGPLSEDIQEAISNTLPWQKSLLQQFRIHDLSKVLESLLSDETNIYLVSDGGLKDQKGSFGVSAGTQDVEIFRIEGPAPGYIEHSNSYRSEAYGLLAGINFLRMLVQTYHMNVPINRKIHMFSDNLSLVRRVQCIIDGKTYPRLFLRSDSDVIMQIANDIKFLQDSNFTLVLEHVKGHQDDQVDYSVLSRESQLNVEADKYATNYIIEGVTAPYDEFSSNPINFYINDNVMNRDMKREIRKASRSPELRKYMIHRFQWDLNTPDLVWWTVHGSTIESFSHADRRRIRKMIFGWLPTCRRLKKYNDELSDVCPSCNTCIETNEHLYTCNCRSRIIVKNKWLEVFDNFLINDRYTPPIIRMLFFNHMISFFSFEAVVMPTIIPTNVQHAINDQNEIGWQQLLLGRLSYKWSIIIADHLDSQHIDNREMTPLIWGRKVVRMLLDVGLQQWKQRNLDGHLLNQHKESSLTRNRLLQRIQCFQSKHHDIPHHHRDFVYREFDILATYTNSNLRSWLKLSENLVRISKPRRRSTLRYPEQQSPND